MLAARFNLATVLFFAGQAIMNQFPAFLEAGYGQGQSRDIITLTISFKRGMSWKALESATTSVALL
jgi:hypothetical protein